MTGQVQIENGNGPCLAFDDVAVDVDDRDQRWREAGRLRRSAIGRPSLDAMAQPRPERILDLLRAPQLVDKTVTERLRSGDRRNGP